MDETESVEKVRITLPIQGETSAKVRQELVDALHLDLVGPYAEDQEHAREILPHAPSKWYLTGFLVPAEAPLAERIEQEEEENLDQVGLLSFGDDEAAPEQGKESRHRFFPSSIGVSVLLSGQTNSLDVEVSWGEYTPMSEVAQGEAEDRSQKKERHWQRIPKQSNVAVNWSTLERPQSYAVPNSGGLVLVVSMRKVPDTLMVPKNTCSVSVFLVNQKPPAGMAEQDKAYVFQCQLKLRSMESFVARPNIRGKDMEDWDEQVADLQYANDYEYAVGHNVSVVAMQESDDTTCYEVRTAWMPTAQVEKVIPSPIADVELGMEALAAVESYEQLHNKVGHIVHAYGRWIQRYRTLLPNDARRKEIASHLLEQADVAKSRIEVGLQTLQNPDALAAFRMANRVMDRAARQRMALEREDKDPTQVPPPTWRPFQLAFLLMNLPGIVDPCHADRETVDLLFFPTGGGKTEAYLGLAAFTLVWRRLQHPGIASAGVSVLMRYTLRLLTLDQLGRAAILICALELERQADPDTLGPWPFEIGLWVGQSATANQMGKKGDNNKHSARAKTLAFQTDDKRNDSPIPLESCPWCGERFTPNSFQLVPNTEHPTNLTIRCTNRNCTYGVKKGGKYERLPLPIVAVDEPIYRRLPCFLIGTVDKFANLPWVGQTGALFGKVERYDKEGFYGAADGMQGNRMPQPLLPPDLIIQDELHLISGPLGTMVGLYETVLDALCIRKIGEKEIRPKIIASTATVRRATRQIRSLFGRFSVSIFPPPGPDRRDSFFAETVSPDKKHARLYVGVAAPGRNAKLVLLRTYLALLGAAQKQWSDAGGNKNTNNPADPYMTLLGYFNSLRELGGSRRIVEDEVNSRLIRFQERKRLNEAKGVFANRKIDDEPVELTSRVSTSQVAGAKRRLSQSFSEKGRVDVALATNMISVGLDITRLGLMVVFGQPKTTAEYIQATSRVGRDDQRPGLVVTLLQTVRPRDRSHYERFQAWHTSFYRAVEATSVTPFSPRAVDRGIAAITVALVRLGYTPMTPAAAAKDILKHRSHLDFVPEMISRRAEMHDKELNANEAEILRKKIRERVIDLLDSWSKIATQKQQGNSGLQYQKEVGEYPPLLYYPLDPALERCTSDEQKFRAGRSLRDIEQSVNLWIRDPKDSEEDNREE